MGRVLTNQISLTYAVEETLGVLPTTPTWKSLEPNAIGTFGATITKVAREPISKDRQRRKGVTTDLDSAAEFEHDLTREVFKDFIEGFVMASTLYPYSGGTTRQKPIQAGASFEDLVAVEGTPDSFDHDAITTPLTAGFLVFVRGFTNAANNGMHEVDAASTVTSTKVTTATLVAETPSNVSGAIMEIAGVRGASGDITLTVVAGVGTLGSTVLDFTTLGLKPGQVIHVGGLLAANQYTAGKGYARITSIAANVILLDKLDATLVTDTGAAKLIDLLYGGFIRNVVVDDATSFLERSYQFEEVLPNLDDTPADEYVYAIGNYASQVTFALPLADKAGISFAFVGTDTEVPTTTQKTGADAPIQPVQTVAYNTTADIARLRITKVDETGLTTVFKSLSLILNNQVSTEKGLGTLGAVYMNTGNFLVNLETQILLTKSAVVTAIRDNTTVTMDFLLKNDDGAIAVDIPSMTLGDGSQELPVNESVLINLSGEAFKDAVLGYSIGVSMIPAVP